MPDWTFNSLKVKGKSKEVKRFYLENRTDEQELSFAKSCPVEDGEDWYYEHCAKWGTKWDIRDIEVENINPNTLIYCFYTAWSPPEIYVLQASEAYPDL